MYMENKNFNLKPKTLPKYITEVEVSSILDKAKKDRFRNYILILTLWRTGMRVSEIVKFRKNQIQDNGIIVRNAKGGKDRVIPLESELSNLLGLFTDGMNNRDIVFKMSDRQVRNIVYKYSPFHFEKRNGKEVKVYDVHPHTIRHSFAVYCLKSGMNLRSLQKILGHSSLTTTQIYLDVVGEDIKNDFEKVDW